ncbi:MAG: ATP-binding protein [Endomicrobium sp.]|nr:ATP-binding protein [Endomicrobium sp.]
MLLEFKVKNFKSFKDEAVFSMHPEKIEDLNYSILKKKVDGKEYKALSSAVIYGPNAAGKTNIVEAMSSFRRIILSGNVLNSWHFAEKDGGRLELVPNVKSAEESSTDFGIKFISEDKEKKKNYAFEYNLSVQFGKFAQKDYQRKILLEQLFVDDKEIFKREENAINLRSDNLKLFLSDNFKKIEFENTMKILTQNLVKTDLFLTSGFKNILSSQLAEVFKNWFLNNFNVVCVADKAEVAPSVSFLKKIKDGKYLKNVVLDKILKELGIVSDMGYYFNKQDNYCELTSVIRNYDNSTSIRLPSRVFESFGTLRLFNLVTILHAAVRFGQTIIMDEFDASIHPMIIMNIINLFHNDEINKNRAQLIFSTHNPIFLNNSLFRRDEIKFVDKEENSDTSILYSLSDFDTDNKELASKTTNYMENYFINRYGAIKDVNLYSVFKEDIDNAEKKGE